MTPNSDLQFIHKESGNSMTTAKCQTVATLAPVYDEVNNLYSRYTSKLQESAVTKANTFQRQQSTLQSNKLIQSNTENKFNEE